ncbi:MAG: type II/IV secretion system ATPase subunit [Chloroflexi bacterium]|nr:type II/IV secretion system ATPase subunit [Chloroflexota bacterium]
MFDIAGRTLKSVPDARPADELERWWNMLAEEGRARKATESRQRSLSSSEIEALARQAFEEVQARAVDAGVALPQEYILRLIGELSGLGPLLELIARTDIEDIAINLGHIYVYTTSRGWEYASPAPEGIGDALRVMIDRAGQRAPTPDYPIADAMLQVMVPLADGSLRRKGVRINYVMPPASPYGDTITLRISNYRTASDLTHGSLALLCQNRLPPVPRPKFDPKDFQRGNGILTPEAANYLLGVMVQGGTLVIAGATGSGKTFVGQRILQEMLDYYPRGAIRLFIVEDSNEIILNGWNGDGQSDTGNIIYTVTRPEIRGGPPPVTMYDLIRAALRSRPHGVVIGEARGAEAWELIRAAATGHGHSAFTIHATSAEHVWPRFLQVVQAHPDAARMSEFQIAQSFAEAVTAAVYIERNPQQGQVVREIVEVSPIVERTAARPSFSPLFRFEVGRGLLPTGNRPMRAGFRATDLNISESIFKP